jgi:hypothetical protein
MIGVHPLRLLRRGDIGIHHHIAGAYLLRYAQESSWREDNRHVSNGDQVNRIAKLALKREVGGLHRILAAAYRGLKVRPPFAVYRPSEALW